MTFAPTDFFLCPLTAPGAVLDSLPPTSLDFRPPDRSRRLLGVLGSSKSLNAPRRFSIFRGGDVTGDTDKRDVTGDRDKGESRDM